MKIKLTLITLLWVFSVKAQTKHAYSLALTTSTDFKTAISALGIESGFYGKLSKHSYLVTFEADWIQNADLMRYNAQNKISELTRCFESYQVGLKYGFRALRSGGTDLSAVVHPWYSLNSGISAVYVGARATFRHWKGDAIAVEVTHDPFVNRSVLRLVFIPQLKSAQPGPH